MTELFDNLSLLRYMVSRLTKDRIVELKDKANEFIHDELSYEFNYLGKLYKSNITTFVTDRNQAFAVEHLFGNLKLLKEHVSELDENNIDELIPKMKNRILGAFSWENHLDYESYKDNN